MSVETTGTPLLSIVIPTRNRYQYAAAAIRSVVKVPSEAVEFIIQDSSDSNALEDYIKTNVCDRRLIYSYSCPPVSTVDNFSRAVERSRGEYLCIIGDDDGINPEIVGATQWAKSNEVDALSPRNSVSYYWPDFRSRYYGAKHAGSLYIESFFGTKNYPHMQPAMRRCVRLAGQGVQNCHLPKVYSGIVRRECMDRMRECTGVYFGGTSPDIYAGLGVASFVRRVCELDYPLIVSGMSRASTAGLAARRQHKGTLQGAENLKAFAKLDWPSGVPRYYSAETVLAGGAVVALRDVGRKDLLEKFNYPLLHALCAVSHPDYLTETMASYRIALKLMRRGSFAGAWLLIVGLIEALLQKAQYIGARLLHPGPARGATVISGLEDIEKAVEAFCQYLKVHGAYFDANGTLISDRKRK